WCGPGSSTRSSCPTCSRRGRRSWCSRCSRRRSTSGPGARRRADGAPARAVKEAELMAVDVLERPAARTRVAPGGIGDRRPLLSSGFLLGVGMGGFVDGILFHQIFQLHNMLSNRLFPDTVVNLEINMFWDGLFHAFTWIVTAVGIALLWRAAAR